MRSTASHLSSEPPKGGGVRQPSGECGCTPAPRLVLALKLDRHTLASLQELGELKRIRSATRAGSIAERLFLASWSALVGGTDIKNVMMSCIAATSAASLLGDIDREVLIDLGVPSAVAEDLLRTASGSVLGLLTFPDVAPLPLDGIAPNFARLLARQPRAGITCPGRPRILFEPPENHAEHCLLVAAYGVALSKDFGADPVTTWLAGMSHHLHNAYLPDSGFAGEVLLGEHLEPVMRNATERALGELALPLRDEVCVAREILSNADTPEGRAFHAADTLDRVWQIDQHLRVARIDLRFVLDEMALVHEGPVKPFQDKLLRAAGLLA